MKKSKIVDLVLFYNEKDILKKRLSYMSEVVDLTIVVNYGNLNLNFLGENVYEIKIDGYFDSIGDRIYDGIVRLFGNKYFKYHDNFIYSKVFEIPDLSTLLDKFNEVDANDNFIFQKKLMWSESYKTIVNHTGPVLLKYKNIQLLKSIFDYYNKSKNDLININLKSDCGWNIQTFQKDEEFLKSLNFWKNSDVSLKDVFYNKTSLYDLDYPNTRLVINQDLDLPKPFKSLSNKINLRNPIKVLITNVLSDIESSNYDLKILISDNNIDIENVVVHNPKSPSRVLYGNKSYNNFKEDFKLDNLLYTLKEFDLIDNDTIDIKIKSESYDSDFTKIYGEFRKSIPSELIKISSSSGTFPKSFSALFERLRFR